MKTIMNIIYIITTVMALAYAYQAVYLGVGLFSFKGRGKSDTKTTQRRFAALICARNESNVISQLIDSLKGQNYPPELLDIFVLADNCTDSTYSDARDAGAIVYQRNNNLQVGKGYALDYLIKRIYSRDDNVKYDGYFIFDADNVVDANFISQMNRTISEGYDVVTCYRNSKNFGTNWISASYSIWFLREARFLNYPRMLLGNSCAVSGTGFFVSDKIVQENKGWPFHMLTEDIQFSVNCALTGHKIGYCDGAIIYDEQPTTFSQSWDQRLRWAKGFYQIDARYLLPLLKNSLTKKGFRIISYDIFMTVAPAMLVTVFAVATSLAIATSLFTQPSHLATQVSALAASFTKTTLINFYIGFFIYACLTVASEWKRIPATTLQKLLYLPMFPIFMASYIPIALVALVCRVQWKPIHHVSVNELALVSSRGDAEFSPSDNRKSR